MSGIQRVEVTSPEGSTLSEFAFGDATDGEIGRIASRLIKRFGGGDDRGDGGDKGDGEGGESGTKRARKPTGTKKRLDVQVSGQLPLS